MGALRQLRCRLREESRAGDGVGSRSAGLERIFQLRTGVPADPRGRCARGAQLRARHPADPRGARRAARAPHVGEHCRCSRRHAVDRTGRHAEPVRGKRCGGIRESRADRKRRVDDRAGGPRLRARCCGQAPARGDGGGVERRHHAARPRGRPDRVECRRGADVWLASRRGAGEAGPGGSPGGDPSDLGRDGSPELRSHPAGAMARCWRYRSPHVHCTMREVGPQQSASAYATSRLSSARSGLSAS
jgi:hypothetical protein